MAKDRVELSPENFCYLSNCEFFISDIESTGCQMDYLKGPKREEVDGSCPLAMERSFRSGDPNWEASHGKMMEKLREIADIVDEDKKRSQEMGAKEYAEALEACAELSQETYDAKIEYERLQFQLQELRANCFGEEEKKQKKQKKEKK